MDLIRVWKEFDIDEVSRHLLMVGDSKGDCANCRELGIDYSIATECPSCKIKFIYIASRTKEINRINNKRKDLIFIDLDDYKKALGRKIAKGLFS